jgi:pyridinium-3,5-biscarboxylic acid mononucleotide sulfurtransferase
MTIDEKFNKLRDSIRALKKAAVAYSGGVDSSLLCRVAYDVLGDEAIAITIVSPMLPRSEIDCAREVTSSIGIRHILVEEAEIEEIVAQNPKDRCYHCKKVEFGNVLKTAAEYGISHVLDGSNLDDLGDYRPGLAALQELSIVSPLREAGLTKAEIRELSKRLNLKTWDKPAFACLASRVPYGERITREKLGRVERAEDYLRGTGLRQFRVRSHGDIARIEVAPEEREKLFDARVMDEASAALKSFGFVYVCMELEGYRMGSLNRVLSQKKEALNG